MQIEGKQPRRRVNIKETAKREKYLEYTMDDNEVGLTEDEFFEQLESFEKRLYEKYPAPIEITFKEK